jgi:hypothetical protein
VDVKGPSKVVLVLVTVLLLAGLSLASTAEASINARRIVEVGQAHLVIYDELYSSEPLNLTVAVPSSLKQGSLLSLYVKREGGCLEPMKLNETRLEGLNVTTYLVIVSREASIIQTYLLLDHGLNRTLYLPLYPLMNATVDVCNVTIKYPEETLSVDARVEAGPSLHSEEVERRWMSTISTSGLPAMRLTWLNATYSLEREVEKAICSRCVKDVYVQFDGSLKVVEKLTFTSIDPSRRIGVFELHLPVNASDVEVYDEFSSFSFTTQVEPAQPCSYSMSLRDGHLVLRVKPRFTIAYRENVTFTLAYHIPPSPVQLASFTNLPILRLELHIHPPPGGSITYAGPLEVRGGGVYVLFSHWPLPVSSAALTYTMAPAPLPLTASLAALAAILAASTAYLLLKPAKPKLAPPPTPDLQGLTAAYQRKLTLLSIEHKLLRELATGKLKLRAYERQLGAIIAEQNRVDAELKERRRRVEEVQPSLLEPLTRLRRLEEQIARLRSECQEALSRMKAGKSTRRGFQEEMMEKASQLGRLRDDLKDAVERLSAKT